MAEAPTNPKPGTVPQSTNVARTPATLTPAFKITRIQADTRWLKMLFYGPFGSGKTTLAATSVFVPQLKDVLYISVEGGELSLSEFPDDLTDNAIEVRNYKQIARVRDFLRIHCRLRDANNLDELAKLETTLRGESVAEPRKYRTVIIDTLSEVYRYIYQQVMGIDLDTVKMEEEPDKAGYDEWGKVLEMSRTMVRSFRDLPMNVIAVCPEMHREIGPKGGKSTIIRPQFQGQFAQEVCGFFDFVGYLRSAPNPQDPNAPEIRRLDLVRGAGYDAKNRIQSLKGLGNYINDPTMLKLVGPIYNKA